MARYPARVIWRGWQVMLGGKAAEDCSTTCLSCTHDHSNNSRLDYPPSLKQHSHEPAGILFAWHSRREEYLQMSHCSATILRTHSYRVQAPHKLVAAKSYGLANLDIATIIAGICAWTQASSRYPRILGEPSSSLLRAVEPIHRTNNRELQSGRNGFDGTRPLACC